MNESEGLGMQTSQGDTSAQAGFYAGAVAGTTALIVEDDPNNAFALRALLQRGSMTIVEAESGPAALDILTRRDDIGIVLVVDGERERCIAAGASAYITKPVDSAALLKAISRWLPPPTTDALRS
jgi:CheY-like chemotaxis protein